MADLKLVPKPEGYELRTRRSDKTRDANDWNAADVLYEASQEIDAERCRTLVIAWQTLEDDGTISTEYRSCGPQDGPLRTLLSVLGRFMGWR